MVNQVFSHHWLTSEKRLINGCPHRIFEVVKPPGEHSDVAVLECGVCGKSDVVWPQTHSWLQAASDEDFKTAIASLEYQIQALETRYRKIAQASVAALAAPTN